MYATRQLSEFRASPEAALQPPPEGPSSGFLVVKEEDHNEEANTCCWGICPGPRVTELPFPQNKILILNYTQQEEGDGNGYLETVLFVPVINLSLSANRYYVVVAKGKRTGQVYTCSKEEDMTPCCCIGGCISDVKPKPFDHRDIYQQMEILPHNGQFTAKAVASDGFPPWIFSQNWTLYEYKPLNCQLGEAPGMNKTTTLNYMNIRMGTSVIAGKWYCPFIFIREGTALKDQMRKSMFFEVTLEQFWEEVYSGTEKKRILLEGKETMREDKEPNDSFIWFRKTIDLTGERIGLSLALWERIKWEEGKNGWIEGDSAMVDEVNLGSFALVERFSFKRLDGRVVFVIDFIHIDKIRAK